MVKAIFLDRDGTINVDYGYMYDPAQLELLEGVAQALRLFMAKGFVLVVVTNQSGIGRGLFTLEEYEHFAQAFEELLKGEGIDILETLMCPHSPQEDCQCRKPNPYMVKKAIAQHNICAADSYMFGDKLSDLECGQAAGVESHLITEEETLLYWAKVITDRDEYKD